MRPTDVILALRSLLPTRRPVYLHGPPGVGKSSLIHQAAADMELEVRDVRAVLLDPVDLRGLPVPNGDVVHWKPPAFLPRGGKGVLFLDELAQAPPLVQAACLQLTLDRRVGEYELPEDWLVVAASNRQEDRAGAHKLITPLLNRFIHLDLDVSLDDWRGWAVRAGIHPAVITYLWKVKPDALFDFDPKAGMQRAFATPRSWEFVSDVLHALPPSTFADPPAHASGESKALLARMDLVAHHSVAGCVGDGQAAGFVGYLRFHRRLPDIDQEVLAKPHTATVPKDPDVMYALSGVLVARCRKAEEEQDAATLEAAATYTARMPGEFAVLTLRDCVQAGLAVAKKSKPLIMQQPAGIKLLTKYHDVLTEAARSSL